MLPLLPPAHLQTLSTGEPGEGLPCDAKDHQPLLLGACTRDQILNHRVVFKDRTAQAEPSEALRFRWMAIQRPFTVVVAFGSWCSDSQHELPSFLALEGQTNPFVEVHFIGVARAKEIPTGAWPSGLPLENAVRVPTAWVFALGPGSSQQLVGSVVEHPSKPGETFAESIVELMEQAK